MVDFRSEKIESYNPFIYEKCHDVKHHGAPKNHFCFSCQGIDICAECVLSGEHKGHKCLKIESF